MKELNYLDITKTGQGHIKVPSATGIHPDMGVGTAQAIQTNIHDTNSVPYVFRPTPYNSTRESGDIVGASVAWNQLVQNGNFASASGWGASAGTFSVANNVGTISITGSNGSIAGAAHLYPIGHKILMMASVRYSAASTKGRLRLYDNATSSVVINYSPITLTANTWADIAFIGVTAHSDASHSLSVQFYPNYNSASSGQTADIKNVMAVDLTLALGSAIADYIYTLESGTAGAGIAKLREWGFFDKPYYAYNAGGIESVNVSKHIMRDGDDNIIGEYPLDSSLTLRGILKLDGSNNLYADGDVYHSDGTVDRNWAERAYEAGDVSDGSTMITDGTTTVYKLQTPTTETADPFQSPQVCSPYGTEEFEDHAYLLGYRDVKIPVGHNTSYAKNIVGAIEGIPLPPSANGTYTLKVTVASGVPTYSWVSG